MSLTNLPEGITSIGHYTFYGCQNLALTSLPAGLTSIGEHAFESCENMPLTSLPYSLNVIGQDAFSSCYNLTTISYAGTKAEWELLNADNVASFSSEVIIKCSDGDVTYSN